MQMGPNPQTLAYSMESFWAAQLDSWWPYVVSGLICLVSMIRLLMRAVPCPPNYTIPGKSVIITGASSGIGLATAKELAGRGANLILAVRNAEKGKEAMLAIKDHCPGANVIIKMVDMSEFWSIRDFSNQILLECDRIDILINNAGIIFHPYTRTCEGTELTMATNYFGPFLLTHLLLPLLNKSESGRVINVSGFAHTRGKINLTDMNSEISYSDKVFANSKLALTMFTKKMAYLLKHTNITFYSADPGLVRGTLHLRHSKLTTSWPTKISVFPWMWLFMNPPQQGCQTVVYAAVAPLLKSVSGCYLSNCSIQPASDAVSDTELSESLYQKTCEIVDINGLDVTEKLVKGTEIKAEP